MVVVDMGIVGARERREKSEIDILLGSKNAIRFR